MSDPPREPHETKSGWRMIQVSVCVEQIANPGRELFDGGILREFQSIIDMLHQNGRCHERFGHLLLGVMSEMIVGIHPVFLDVQDRRLDRVRILDRRQPVAGLVLAVLVHV